MPNESLTIAQPAARLSARHVAMIGYGAVIAALSVHFWFYLQYALPAVRYPFELDYGEGIVWQQALLVPGPRMYGDITQYPFIVFHYPPLYYLTVRALAVLNGDMLLAGRALSLCCTLAIGALVAILAYSAPSPRLGRGARLIGGVVGGLAVFCFWPVVFWSPFMRVDMLATLLTFLGLWLAGQSSRHRWLLPGAVIAFVLAVYTKQVSVAAPLAVLCVTWREDRPAAVRSFGLGLVIGLPAFLALTWMTGGDFLRHLLFYNINRYSFMIALTTFGEEAARHAIFLLIALAGLAAGWHAPSCGERCGSREEIGQKPGSRLMRFLTLYLVFSTIMLVTLGKSGGSKNYFIEWMCICAVMIGVFAASAIDHILQMDPERPMPRTQYLIASLLAPLALVVQVLLLPTGWDYGGGDTARRAQLESLVARIRDAPRPVLSADMVLLLKADKEVPWEPSIFAELASTGHWDEQPIVDMIARRDFSFIVTTGHKGERIYDERYTPAVEHAMLTAYPRTEDMGGRTLHLPMTE